MLVLAFLIPFFLYLHFFFFLVRRLIESLRIVIIIVVIVKNCIFFLLHLIVLFTLGLKLRLCFYFYIVQPRTLCDFIFVHSLSESLVPALAEVESFPSWDLEIRHDLASLAEDVLSLHFRVASDKICQSNLHFWKSSSPSALFLLEFFSLVPSSQVFGVYFLLFGFGSYNLGQRLVGPLQLFSDLSNQLFFEGN